MASTKKRARTEAAHRLLHVVGGDERVRRPRRRRGAAGDVRPASGPLHGFRHRRRRRGVLGAPWRRRLPRRRALGRGTTPRRRRHGRGEADAARGRGGGGGHGGRRRRGDDANGSHGGEWRVWSAGDKGGGDGNKSFWALLFFSVFNFSYFLIFTTSIVFYIYMFLKHSIKL